MTAESLEQYILQSRIRTRRQKRRSQRRAFEKKLIRLRREQHALRDQIWKLGYDTTIKKYEDPFRNKPRHVILDEHRLRSITAVTKTPETPGFFITLALQDFNPPQAGMTYQPGARRPYSIS